MIRCRIAVVAFATVFFVRGSIAVACTTDAECVNLLAAPHNADGKDNTRCAERVCRPNGQCAYLHADHDGDGHGFKFQSGDCLLPSSYSFADSLAADDCDDDDNTSYPGTPNATGPTNWDGPIGMVDGVAMPDRCDGANHDCVGGVNDKTAIDSGGHLKSCTCTYDPNHPLAVDCFDDEMGNPLDIPRPTGLGNCAPGRRYCGPDGKWETACHRAVGRKLHDTCTKDDDANCNGIKNDDSPCIFGVSPPLACPFPPNADYCGGGTYACRPDCSLPNTFNECQGITVPMCPFSGDGVQTSDSTKMCSVMNRPEKTDPPIADIATATDGALLWALSFGQTHGAKTSMTFTPTISNCPKINELPSTMDVAKIACSGDMGDVHQMLTLGNFQAQQPITLQDPFCIFVAAEGTSAQLTRMNVGPCALTLSRITYSTTTSVSFACPPKPGSPGPCHCRIGGRVDDDQLRVPAMVVVALALWMTLRRRERARLPRPPRATS